MKSKKMSMSKIFINIFIGLGTIMFFGLCVYLDLKYNLSEKCSEFEIVSIILTYIPIIITVLFSFFMLFKEIYYNRPNFQEIFRKLVGNNLKNYILLGLDFIVGLILIIFENFLMLTNVYYVVISFALTIYICISFGKQLDSNAIGFRNLCKCK